jgi:hypothetical protein
MLLVADTHVHIYPSYNLEVALGAAFENLGRLAGQASGGVVRVACLTERHDCHMFKALRAGNVTLDPRYSLHHHGDEVLMVARDGGEELLLIVAGRQIVTRERLEVLALTADAEIPDGLAIGEVLERVRGAGGVPVLPWGAGKWLFGRGRVIRRIVNAAQKGTLLVGDSSLRPAGWGEPGIMSLARSRGIRVVAGSDPLPVPGEEQRIGTYGILGEYDFNWRDPLGSIRGLLLESPSLRTVGERGDVRTVWSRLMAHRRMKKGGCDRGGGASPVGGHQGVVEVPCA